jgi:hypothetical protein
MREYSYKSLPDYEDFIAKNSYPVSQIQLGKFYSFMYDFKLNPDFLKLTQRELAYYDIFPLVFMYKKYVVGQDQLVWRGINLHHITHDARLHFLDIVFKMFDMDRDDVKSRNQIRLNWSMIEMICDRFNPKLSLSFRQYYPERMIKPVQIDSKTIIEACKFTAPTFEANNYRHIYDRYVRFQPKN